jgi:hypothetical protein
MKRNLVFTIFALSTVFFAFQNCSHKVDFNGLSSTSPSDKSLVATDAADGSNSTDSANAGSGDESGAPNVSNPSASNPSSSNTSVSVPPNNMGNSDGSKSNSSDSSSNASNSSDPRSSQTEPSENSDSSNGDLVRCDLQNGFKLGIINNGLDGAHPNVQAVCISRAKCLNDVSKHFDVKAARDIGACAHNPHMTVLSDAELDALLAKLSNP